MKNYRVQFRGRQSGAIGIFYSIDAIISAANDKEFAESFYKQYELTGSAVVSVDGVKYPGRFDFAKAFAGKEQGETSEVTEIPADDNLLVGEFDADAVIDQLFRYYKGRIVWKDQRPLYPDAVYIKTREQLEDVFGLAYTSGSEVAGVWNTNSLVEFRSGYFIKGFAVSKKNELVMLTSNNGSGCAEKWRHFVLGYLPTDAHE